MNIKKLRIAFVTPEYVTEKVFEGGLANYVHRTAKALVDLGHEIHVIAISEIDESEFDHENISVHRVMSSRALPKFNYLTRYRLTTASHLLDRGLQVHRKLKALHARAPLDLVQIPNSVFSAFFSKRFLNVPYVLRASSFRPDYHAVGGFERKLDLRMVERLERLQLRMSDHVIAPSRTMQQTLRERVALNNVRVMPTPAYIETTNWDYSVYDEQLKGKDYVLFFGRFGLRKGFHVLARALPRFMQHCPEAYVVLVGRDQSTRIASSMADYARSCCEAFADRLIVMDKLRHIQLYPIVSNARLVVLPSLFDNLPNACLEAMALGKAVLGTTGASFEEMIDDERSGFLVERNNPEALTDKMIHAWSHPRLSEIGIHARARMADFSPDKTMTLLLDFYQDVMRQRREQRGSQAPSSSNYQVQ
jgi:glycosyltransferase involved in cell wall biosynthesis